jgi:hypothetical protein
MISKLKIISRGSYFERFLIKTVSFLLILFFFSCDKDEVSTEAVTKTLDITIDNQNLKITNSSISSNENCDAIFVSCRYYKNDDNGFSIEFWLNKKGTLRSIRVYDYRNRGYVFETANFNPKGLMAISNFKYDETTKYLHFDFNGELIQETYSGELNVEKARKHIEGIVDIKDVKKTKCDSYSSNLNFVSNDLNFSTIIPVGSFDSKLKINPYKSYFYSDNGYRIVLKSSKNLWNLDKETYTFDQNTVENRIDFEKYIGIYRFTQIGLSEENEWKKYQTAGSYTILEHTTINGEKVTKGEFNLQVFDNGTLKYNITNAKFEVVGF